MEPRIIAITGPLKGTTILLSGAETIIGRDPAKAAILTLRDPDGNPRLRMLVDSLGSARIEFLDAAGKVTNSVNGSGSK